MHERRSVAEEAVGAGPGLGSIASDAPAAAASSFAPSSTAPSSETEPDDQTLLARCRRGEAAAWTALVRRYERLVFTVAVRNGLDRDDAADVTQTTFTVLLESIDDLVRSERLASWLMTVARRTAWRHRRGAQRERERADLLDVPRSALVDPIEDFERAEMLHGALGRLAPPCRDLLVALYLDPAEPTYAEVADRTGRAVGTIGPARARCLRRLRQVMTDTVGDVA